MGFGLPELILIGGVLLVPVVIVFVVIALVRSKGGSNAPKPPAPNPREDLSNFGRQTGNEGDRPRG